ncbi:hypothetical protein G6F53_011039 [Rhizopus delemar]|nr:hypothetical protein G6F54_010813 [Rhizopus delemar]KAG1501631.1 hypothetical protein G6F53_011039 [Rhizopus delemar]
MPEYYGFRHGRVRNVRIQTQDNVTIGAWHILPADYYEKYQKHSKFDFNTIFDDALKDYDTFIYFHGNALHRVSSWRIEFYKLFSSKFSHSNLIAIDYRGFGDSESTPTEEGLRLDAQGTLKWLNERQVTNDRISLIGHSLGTGVATTLAYEMAKSGQPAKSLILQAGYASITTLVFEYNILPYLPLLTPLTYYPVLEEWAISNINHRFNSLSRIQHVECPVLIIYGTKDWKIPILNSHKLFYQAITIGDEEYSDIEGLVNKTVIRHVIPNEAVIYKSKQKPQVNLVGVNHADHNNLGYFEITYESIKEIVE